MGFSPASVLANYKPTFKEDWLASVVVFLVALPLCLGIAIAMGYPPEAGLLSAVIGGMIVGLFTGCPLQVSGPAAGLITIVWEAHQQIGFAGLGMAIFIAGLLQVGMGLLGLGLWFRAVSPSVIQGMLAGIGVLIFSSQCHVMVDDKPKSDGVENLLTIPQAVMKGVFPLDGSVHHLAAAIGLVTIVTIVLWNFAPKKLKIMPPPLVAVAVATLVANMLALPINYVEVPGSLTESLHLMQFNADWFALAFQPEILIIAATMAFIASAETLLTATAVDQLAAQVGCLGKRTHYNREMMAQGIGNTLAGMIGALPITGVIVRSSANVQAGACTNLSAILHGLWILFFVLLTPFVLEVIPVAALAAVLVYTGYKLVDVKAIRKLASYNKSEVAIYLATLLGIVMTNLLEGVLLGLGLSLLKHFYNHAQLHVCCLSDTENQCTDVYLKGSASFVTLPKLATQIEALPYGREVCVHMDALAYIDHACIDFLKGWQQQYEMRGGLAKIQWESVVQGRQAHDDLSDPTQTTAY